MSAALFHETHGFYTRAPAIGSPVGPFDTNAKFTAFGFGVAQAITQAAKVMGGSLRVLELGGGTGQLGIMYFIFPRHSSRICLFLKQAQDYELNRLKRG